MATAQILNKSHLPNKPDPGYIIDHMTDKQTWHPLEIDR